MADYFQEHQTDEDVTDDRSIMARFLVESGWSYELALLWEDLFPNKSKAASKKAVAELERVDVRDLKDLGQCSICLAPFSENDKSARLIRMPCQHLFHQPCIIPWLKLTNTCPYCRKEIPAEDPLYESYKKDEERGRARMADIEELHNSMFS
uniref:RING-type domain-containing protein n=1 Tax=Syphacia muris TaxID=451379 RepID=A0A0N5ARC0_9BILA